MGISYIFPYLVFISGSIALVCGINALYLDKKARSNKIYMVLAISLQFWAMGLALSTVAPNLGISLFWRHMSALGWGPFYSVLLHFIMLFTGRDGLLKKWWGYLILYVPAAVVVCAFALPIGINSNPYEMIHSSFGWINAPGRGPWYAFFYLYFSLALIIGLILIISWARSAKTTQEKRRSRALLISYLAAAIIGTATDVVLGFYSIATPNIAPIVIIIPIAVIAYIIRKYGFLASTEPNKHEIILNKETQFAIYRHLSILIGCGMLLHIVTQTLLYKSTNYINIIGFSTFLILLIAIVEIINRSTRSDTGKEMMIGIFLSAAIPLFTLAFIERGGVTVWSFVFIAIIIALAFNRLIILSAVVSSSVFTQLFMWTIHSNVELTVYQPDYIVRTALILLAAGTAGYINKLYVSKLKENTFQIGLQKLVSDVSYDLIPINIHNSSEKLIHLLEQVGKFILAENGHLLLLDSATGTVEQTYSWHRSIQSTTDDTVNPLPPYMFPEFLDRITSNKVVELHNAHNIPTEIPRIRQTLIDNNIVSLIALPVLEEGSVTGCLSFSSSESFGNWNLDTPLSLSVIRNIVSHALQKVEQEREIDFLAYYDQLTKLPNRVLFNERANQAIHLAKRAGNMLAIVFIDLDSFKTVNDSMGHELGDQLLVKIASMLQSKIRKSDAISRFGGDEFIMMLGNIANASDVHNIMESMISLFNKPILLNEQEFYVTASLGVALYPQDGEDIDTLVRNADVAMYSAKGLGKNQYKLCSDDMKDEIIEEIRLTNLLYRADKRGEFSLLYQPQVHLENNQIVALEALIRWNLPGTGTVAPLKFIHLAERSGAIHTIGEWVLRSVVRQNKQWQDMGLPKVRISVNVSINQLRNPDFPAQIDTILKEEGLPPEYLELEVTERIASQHAEAIINAFEKIKQLGVSISIDDFGSEYTALAKLNTLPIDRIKIDMPFVHGIEGTEEDRAAAKVLICVSKTLGIKVTAEGVETQNQLDFLNQKLCDEVQGYYLYKPMPAHEIEELLKNTITQ